MLFKILFRRSDESSMNTHSLIYQYNPDQRVFCQCIDKQLSSLGQLIVQKFVFKVPLRRGNERNTYTTVNVVKLCQVSAKKIFPLLGSINRQEEEWEVSEFTNIEVILFKENYRK